MGTEVLKTTPGGGSLSISEVCSRAGSLRLDRDYFETGDGFIAFNLSKSVIHTTNPYPIQPSDTLFSGLSNPIIDQVFGSRNTSYSNLYVSEVPLFNIDSNVVYEDVRSHWTVAPVFSSDSPCLHANAPLHVTCMLSNKIIAWAFSTDAGSFCRTMHSNSCNAGGKRDYRLSIYSPMPFDLATPPTTGISGMVMVGPPAHIVEAVMRRFVADGWPIEVDTGTYPTGPPTVWIEPMPNVIAFMDDLLASFNIFKYVAVFLVCLTMILMIIPLFLDVQTDLLVRKLIAHQLEVLTTNALEEKRRRERRKQVEVVNQLKLD
jgi:hypothetical protein